MGKRWHYMGDINLENGGYYWQEDGADDYVNAVEIQPCSDAGGPNNLFWITVGSVYMPKDREQRALECCGWHDDGQFAKATPAQKRAMLVDAHKAYHGIEADMYGQRVVQIGATREPARDCESVQPDIILRANASLENYVRKTFLR